jgi:type I restriction enzyme R subunit
MERVLATRPRLNKALTPNQEGFIHFVFDRYVATGVEELDDERLPDLIKLKYKALQDGIAALGGVDAARQAFIGLQQSLYQTG